MHYSRVSVDPAHAYSPAAAVLLTELLKGSISLFIAFARLDSPAPASLALPRLSLSSLRRLAKEIFRPDCWKLSVPAILYVIQNNLQFVAVSNLQAATFQVTYQIKILSTAAFSVLLLRKKLSPTKWLALLCLAVGVGIVQIANASSHPPGAPDMNAFKGFMAVFAACFTSGLAGVYFEMVLKNSQADLWVRNVQLSLFSLLPALLPLFFTASPTGPFSLGLFDNFGAWAWATVAVQVLGGLLTALVIKYADNILKGFATSLSIVISFLASVALFNFQITITFVLGSTVVLVATWMYNQTDFGSPDDVRWRWQWRRQIMHNRSSSAFELAGSVLSRRASFSSLSSAASSRSYPGSPAQHNAPLLGHLSESKRNDLPARVLSVSFPRTVAYKIARLFGRGSPTAPAYSLVFAAAPEHAATHGPSSPVVASEQQISSPPSAPSLSINAARPSGPHPSRPASAMSNATSLSPVSESSETSS